MNEKLYAEANELVGYNALALKAMALWAYAHRRDGEAMRVASFVWGRNARIMARAVKYFPKDFDDGAELTADDYLSRFALAQLPLDLAAIEASDAQDQTLAAWQVRERVDALRKRKPRAKKEVLAELVANRIALVDLVIDGHEYTAGDCIRDIESIRAIADALAARDG